MEWSAPTEDAPSRLMGIWLRPWWRILPGARRLLDAIEDALNEPGVLEVLTPGPEEYVGNQNGFLWYGLMIPSLPRGGIKNYVLNGREAIAEITDLLRAAHAELVECRRRGDARPYEGTAEIHSDGEPPIAYVIDRIERMLGDVR